LTDLRNEIRIPQIFLPLWLDTVGESRPDTSALLKTASGTELGFEYIPF